MFDDFKQKVKMIAKSKCLTYAQIAERKVQLKRLCAAQLIAGVLLKK